MISVVFCFCYVCIFLDSCLCRMFSVLSWLVCAMHSVYVFVKWIRFLFPVFCTVRVMLYIFSFPIPGACSLLNA